MPAAGSRPTNPASDSWFVYIVQCKDQSLYTGIAKNLVKRLQAHNHGRDGAKYTRARRPVRLVYLEMFSSRSAAAKREYALKQLRRVEKLRLIARG